MGGGGARRAAKNRRKMPITGFNQATAPDLIAVVAMKEIAIIQEGVWDPTAITTQAVACARAGRPVAGSKSTFKHSVKKCGCCCIAAVPGFETPQRPTIGTLHMIRLLYISQTNTEMSAEEVQAIAKLSHRNNAMQGITGLMLTGGCVFAQVLEGPELNVLRLYVKIIEDSRHFNCQLVHISPSEERLFEHWYMGSIEATPLELEQIDEMRAHREESVSSAAFKKLMQQFVARLREQ